jgi:gliding motility-associated-like protein
MGVMEYFTYFWQESTNFGVSWTNIAGSLTQNYQPGAIGQTTVFRRVVSSSVCSDTSNRDTITIVPAIQNNTIGAYQRFCGSGNPANIVGVPATGGTGTYIYSWEESADGTNWTPIVGVNTPSYDPPAVISTTTYYHRIVRSSICTSISNISKVAILQLPVVSQLVKTDLTCFMSNNGSINITGNSFNGGLTYSIDSGAIYQLGANFTNLPIGSYNVFLRDDSNCVKNYNSNPVVITQPDSLYLTSVKVDASCSNVSNGQINVTPNGGTPNYTYSLNGGGVQPSGVFAGLAGGTYLVTLYDRNGCQDTATVVITNSYSVVASIDSQRNVSCFGGNDGQVAVKLTGGTAPLSYSINGIVFQSNPIFSGLSAATYLITLKDAKGCTDVLSVNLTQPNAIQVRIDSVKNGLCSGGSAAGIYITPSGGTAPYTYLWSNGAVTEDLIAVGAGTYSVTITDSKGCTGTNGATVSEPLPLFVTVAQFNDVLCNGDSSGTIDITVSGGTPPYSFLWSNADTTEDLSGLKAGSYTVTVTDANTCAKSLTQVINEPLVLSGVVSSTSIACSGGNNGTASVLVSGGVVPYSYLWSNGATTASITGLAGGTFTVTATDKNGCKYNGTVNINSPQPIVLATSVTNILCNGASTGSIILTPSGGTPTYTYAWSNGATTKDLTSVAAGAYTVTVTDQNLCTATASATITQSTALILSGTAFNALCAGTNNGSISLSITGGNGPYTYAWSNAATTKDLQGLGAGTYTVTVSDANSCTAVASFMLSQPTALVSNIVGTNINCNGTSNGAADLTVSGGVAPYTYLWNTFQSAQDLTNISGGWYYVVITDANGCDKRDSVLITEPTKIQLSTTVTNVLCNGATTGAVVLSVSGGVPAYTYTWSNGATTKDLTAVAAGTYTVTVRDQNLCTVTASATITQSTALILSGTAFNALCAGTNNGSISLSITGGNGPYTYAWSNAATTKDLQGLGAGTYTVTVSDVNSCTATATYTLSQPTAITSSIIGTNVTCFGANNGAANLTVGGGVAPYTFLWSNFNGAKDLTNIPGGVYRVIITDANGCSKRDSIVIEEPTPLATTQVVTNISCFNANDGSIAVSVSGGTSPYTYTWSTGQNTATITNLAQATYTLTVRDVNSCSIVTSGQVVNPPGITLSAIVKDPLCNAANGNNAGGSIDLIPNGGTPSYTYAWSNGQITQNIASLQGGVFTVTVTDTRGCTATHTSTIVEPDAIFYNVFTTNVSCKDAKDGFLDITAYGGTLPYSFQWSQGNLTEDVGSLNGGNYQVTITDKNSCTVSGFFTVREPDSLHVSLTKIDATCQGANTGSVTAIATGGTRQYDYLWNNFNKDSSQSAIPGGVYTVVVTDSNGCKVNAAITVNGQPSTMSSTKSVSSPTCADADNGFASIAITGGALPYTFNWNTTPAQTGNMATNLAGGSYIVTTTDAVGCNRVDTLMVIAPAAIVVSANTSNASCANTANGNVTVTSTGGKAPLLYTLNGFTQSSNQFTGIMPGTYSVSVRDANGCESVSSVTILSPAAFAIDLTASKEVILATQTVNLYTNVQSDTTITKYVWTPVSANFDFSNCTDSANCPNPMAAPMQTTTIVVTAINARGCEASDTIRIEVSNDLSQFIPTAFTPNADGLNDFFEFDILGATNLDVNVWNRWGEKVFSNPSQINGISQSNANGAWDGMFRGKKVQFDTYTYMIEVTYFNGKKDKVAGTVTVMQ